MEFVVIILIVAFLTALLLLPFLQGYIDYRRHADFIDDGKPIPNQSNMEIHCSVVHTGIALYQALDCAVCPYKEECEKFELRYNRLPYQPPTNKNYEEHYGNHQS